MSKEKIRETIEKMEKSGFMKNVVFAKKVKAQPNIDQLKKEVWKLIYDFTEPDIQDEMKSEFDRIFSKHKVSEIISKMEKEGKLKSLSKKVKGQQSVAVVTIRMGVPEAWDERDINMQVEKALTSMISANIFTIKIKIE